MTSVTASEIFDFLENRTCGTIERHEFNCNPFSVLRRCIRQISQRLRESDAQDMALAEQLRASVCEWLTSPVSFSKIGEWIFLTLPDNTPQRARWDTQLRILHEEALASAHLLATTPNPLAESLLNTMMKARDEHKSFKVYCHRGSRNYFDAIADASKGMLLRDSDFCHSVQAYRDTELFGMLIKVGPLRSSGWGAVPDAVLTSPRFSQLAQFVWRGSADEPGFGYDPASLISQPAEESAADSLAAAGGRVSWARTISAIGDPPEGPAIESVDDLASYRPMGTHRDERGATMVHLDNAQGMLFPRHAGILSFDPDPSAPDPISWRVAGESLVAGMYVVEPVVSEVDLGKVTAGYGHYSRIWKTALAQANEADPLDLFIRLRDAGLDLDNLSAAIDHWCRPPSTVIHAPRRVRHFEILICNLDIDESAAPVEQGKSTPFWRRAWEEIRHSRGDAIQAGFDENEIVQDELRDILVRELAVIRRNVTAGVAFELQIPSATGFTGTFKLHFVHAVIEGFRAPEASLRRVLPIATCDQWRE